MMKKLLTIALIFLVGYINAQDISRIDSLKVKGGATFENIIDVDTNRIRSVGDPVEDYDAINKQYFDNNAISQGVPIDSLLFSTNIANLQWDEGKIYYDSITGGLIFFNEEQDIALNIGFESWIKVKNNTAGIITNGSVVYPTGVENGNVTIGLADAKERRKSSLVGVVTHDIAIGEIGYVTKAGEVGNLNTTGFDPDSLLYLSPDIPGTMTNTRPDNGEFAVILGAVKTIDNDSGSIIVDIVPSELATELTADRGWSKIHNTTIIPTAYNRTLKVIPTTGNSFYYYQDGVKYESDGDTIVFNDTEGTIDFYYVNDVLTAAYNQTESQVRETYTKYAGVSRAYWDAVNDTIIFINNMRHGFKPDGETWAMSWDFHKCEVLEGLALTDIIADASGDLDAHAQFGNESGLIRNQGILTSIPSQTSTTGYTVFYRDGATAWRSQDGAPFPVLTTGTGRLAWNEEVGGSWQLSEVPNNDYVLYHLFVSNTLGDKLGTVIGQSEYATIAAAQAGALTEIQNLLIGQFPIKELAPVATLIYQTADVYANAVNARIVSAEDIQGNPVDYIDWRFQIIPGGGTGTTTTTYLGLLDTPSTNAGEAGKSAVVNPGETGHIYEYRTKSVNSKTVGSSLNVDVNLDDVAEIDSITDVNVSFNSNSYTKLASGTTAQRPASPINGMYRYDSDLTKAQTYENGEWKNLITSATDINLFDYVKGALSSTDNAIALWDGTTGKLIKNSSATIDGSGNLDVTGSIETVGLTSTDDVEINGGIRPQFIAGQGTVKTHFGDLSGAGTLFFSSNLSYDGANWNLDDTGVAGIVISSAQTTPLRIRTATSGTNPRTLTELLTSDGSGNFTFSGNVSSNPPPTLGDHLTNKTYVDAAIGTKANLPATVAYTDQSNTFSGVLQSINQTGATSSTMLALRSNSSGAADSATPNTNTTVEMASVGGAGGYTSRTQFVNSFNSSFSGTEFSIHTRAISFGAMTERLKIDDVGNLDLTTGSYQLNGSDLKIGDLDNAGLVDQVYVSDGLGGGSWEAQAGGQWSTDANGINYQAGNVGIGRTSPVADALEVEGDITINGDIKMEGSNYLSMWELNPATHVPTPSTIQGIFYVNSADELPYMLNGSIDTLSLSTHGIVEMPDIPSATKANMLYFDTTTKEVSYGAAPSGGTPAGSSTQIQYNDEGSFGASSDFTYNDTSKKLEMGATTEALFGGVSDAGNFDVQCIGVYNGGKQAHQLSLHSGSGTLGIEAGHTYILESSHTYTNISLPSVSTNIRVEYVIVNHKASATTITSYVGLDGATKTTIPAQSSITVQSNGTNWYRIQ
jgi:hypothetical protein